MGLALILIGLIVGIFLSWFWGVVLIIIGVLLFLAPSDNVYGYSRWHGRRRGPP